MVNHNVCIKSKKKNKFIIVYLILNEMVFKRKRPTGGFRARTQRPHKRRYFKARRSIALPRRRQFNKRRWGGKGTVPTVKIVKMRYQAHYDMTIPATTANGTERVFNLTSINDPDHTGVGSQPFGHDEWSGLYNRYQVMGVKVKVVTHYQSDTELASVMVPTLGGTALVTQNFAYIQNLPKTKTKLLDAARSNFHRMSNYYSIKGLDKTIGDGTSQDEDYQATFNSDPTQGMYVHLLQKYPDDNAFATDRAVSSQVRLIYYVKLFSPKHLSLS